MKFRDFLIGWRFLVKEPGYSAVVLAGLSIGIAVCFLLLGFVGHSMRYDAHVPDVEQVYLTNVQFNYKPSGVEWNQQSPQALIDVAARIGPQVKATGYVEVIRSVLVNNVVHEVQLYAVSPAFPAMFGVKPVSGSAEAALAGSDGLTLTAETAERLFGGAEALGQIVRIGGESLRVMAIVPNPPATSTTPYAGLVGFNSVVLDEKFRENLMQRWGLLGGKVFVKLGAGASPEAVSAQLQAAIDASPLRAGFPPDYESELGGKKLMEVRLWPLRDSYFQSDIQIDDNPNLHGDKKTVFALAGIAVLILALAMTNYVNLTTVRTLRRQREVALRKLMGASISRVAGQFLAESVLVAMLTAILGLLLAWMLQNPFALLVGRTLDQLFTPASVAVTLVAGFLAGMLAGAYPAYVALKVRAQQALSGRGNSETKGGLWVRRVLTVLQFSTAMGLTAVCVAIAWQTNYASSLNPGFEVGSLLHLDLPRKSNMSTPQNQAFRDALLRVPGVRGVAAAREIVGRHETNSIGSLKQPGNRGVNIAMKAVSPEFFSVYGIGAVAGRVFDPKIETAEADAVVVNDSAALALGFASAKAAVGQFVTDDGGGTPSRIIGVAAEVRHTSLHQPVGPIVYFIGNDNRALTLRFDGQVQQVEQAVEAVWKQYFPNDMLNLYRAQTFFDLDYADDLRVAKMLGASTVISIAIAAFGIYVLAAYGVQRRRREIVLRKLYGASRMAIARLIGREFVMVLGASALIALPLAALVTERHLSGFSERAPIHGWALLAGLVAVALTAQVSTLRHVIGAIRIRPAEALRD